MITPIQITRPSAPQTTTEPPDAGVIFGRIFRRGSFTRWAAFLFDGSSELQLVDSGQLETDLEPGRSCRGCGAPGTFACCGYCWQCGCRCAKRAH